MMDSVRRYVWVVDLIGIAIGAVLAGHATATFLAARLPQQPTPVSRAPARSGPTAATPGKSIDAIVDRNVFCSTCGSDGPVLERTRRALRLLAIMFARSPADSRWSVAIIRDDEAATTGPYGVGARLGEATIAAIDEVRVILEDGHGHHEVLDLLPRWPDERLAGRGATFEDVRRIGTQRYEVRREALDRFLQGGVTPPWPRIVPQTRDGHASGLLLAGVRPDTVFAALGLASGDVLAEVNGRSIATPDAALAAYGALQTADHFSLVIERGGRRVRLDYVIR